MRILAAFLFSVVICFGGCAAWFLDGISETRWARQPWERSLWQLFSNEWTFAATVGNKTWPPVFAGEIKPFGFEESWHARLTTTYTQALGDNLTSGASVSLGLPSQKPIVSLDDITLGMDAFLKPAKKPHFSWVIELHWSTRDDAPVSRIQFIWQRSEHMRTTFGVLYPFSDDRPSFDLSVQIER